MMILIDHFEFQKKFFLPEDENISHKKNTQIQVSIIIKKILAR